MSGIPHTASSVQVPSVVSAYMRAGHRTAAVLAYVWSSSIAAPQGSILAMVPLPTALPSASEGLASKCCGAIACMMALAARIQDNNTVV